MIPRLEHTWHRTSRGFISETEYGSCRDQTVDRQYVHVTCSPSFEPICKTIDNNGAAISIIFSKQMTVRRLIPYATRIRITQCPLQTHQGGGWTGSVQISKPSLQAFLRPQRRLSEYLRDFKLKMYLLQRVGLVRLIGCAVKTHCRHASCELLIYMYRALCEDAKAKSHRYWGSALGTSVATKALCGIGRAFLEATLTYHGDYKLGELFNIHQLALNDFLHAVSSHIGPPVFRTYAWYEWRIPKTPKLIGWTPYLGIRANFNGIKAKNGMQCVAGLQLNILRLNALNKIGNSTYCMLQALHANMFKSKYNDS